MTSRLAIAPKARCCSSLPLWRHPHGATASRSFATGTTSAKKNSTNNGPISLTSPRITTFSLSNRTNNAQLHHSNTNSYAQSSNRSLSFQAPTMGRRLTGRNIATPLIAARPSWNNSISSSVATNTALKSAGSSLVTVAATKRGFFTNSEQKEAEDVVSFYDDKVTQ
ncbi:hypothetical protein BGZ90_009203, partial [Linnemannia elongata]